MKHYVYYHIDPIENQIKYVGKGSGCRAFETKYRRSPKHLNWIRSMEKKGISIKIEIVEYFEDEKEAYLKEKELIKYLRDKGLNLLNISPGGGTLCGENNPMYGRLRPDLIIRNQKNTGKSFEELYGDTRAKEIRKKMSEANSGEKNGAFGLKRADLSERNSQAKGKTLEQMHGNEKAKTIRKNLSKATSGQNNPMHGRSGQLAPCYGRTGESHPMFGKKQTDESKEKISNSLKLRMGKPIIRSDGKTYICLIDAAKELGLKDQKQITQVLKGKKKT